METQPVPLSSLTVPEQERPWNFIFMCLYIQNSLPIRKLKATVELNIPAF